MPAYDYQCDVCACRFERRQKMSDAAIDSCPTCGGAVRRLIGGGAGVIAKGGGSHFAAHAEAQPGCGLGGPCCGRGGGCGAGEFCEN